MISEAASSWRALMHTLWCMIAGPVAKVNARSSAVSPDQLNVAAALPAAQQKTRSERTRALIASGIGAALGLHVTRERHTVEMISRSAPSGAVLNVEVARTPEARAAGLAGRNRVTGDGLLLQWPHCGEHPIWTAGMTFPLDLAWLDDQRRVVGLVHGSEPCVHY